MPILPLAESSFIPSTPGFTVGVLLSGTDAKKTARLPCKGFDYDRLPEGHFDLGNGYGVLRSSDIASKGKE
jgi:hypothetical protein